MSAESPKAAVEDLIAKVVGGKALEAFDRYYADDVTMQENEQPPRVGKAACRAFEEDFLSKIKAGADLRLRWLRDFGQQGVHCLPHRCRSCRVGYTQHERGSHSGMVERKSGAREICLLIH
jgi:ketosteroid isomerase-like protein